MVNPWPNRDELGCGLPAADFCCLLPAAVLSLVVILGPILLRLAFGSRIPPDLLGGMLRFTLHVTTRVRKAVEPTLLQTRLQVGQSSFILGTESLDLGTWGGKSFRSRLVELNRPTFEHLSHA